MASVQPNGQEVRQAVDDYIDSFRRGDPDDEFISFSTYSEALEIISKVEDPEIKKTGIDLLAKALYENDPDNAPPGLSWTIKTATDVIMEGLSIFND